jgi:hypothetical protein
MSVMRRIKRPANDANFSQKKHPFLLHTATLFLSIRREFTVNKSSIGFDLYIIKYQR